MLVQQRLPYYSLGYWLGKICDGDVFTYTKGNLEKSLEEYLPLILAGFPLPLTIIVPALSPKSNRIGMQIVHGGDFFEALYRFYRSELYVCLDNSCWLSQHYDFPSNKLTWNTTPDKMKIKIFYTGIYVTKLLSSEEKYFTSAQIEELSKIDFHF